MYKQDIYVIGWRKFEIKRIIYFWKYAPSTWLQRQEDGISVRKFDWINLVIEWENKNIMSLYTWNEIIKLSKVLKTLSFVLRFEKIYLSTLICLILCSLFNWNYKNSFGVITFNLEIIKLFKKQPKFVICMVRLLLKLSYTKHDFDNDSKTLVWSGVCMGMEDLHENLRRTINYNGGSFCCSEKYCQDFL